MTNGRAQRGRHCRIPAAPILSQPRWHQSRKAPASWSGMHILVTTDTVGGVWTYTRELVTGLALRGIRVTLVSFGGIPGRAQTAWLEKFPDVAYFPTGFRLEWMQGASGDIADSARYLRGIVHECRPDLLHLSQYCYGSLDVGLPKIVVAHSDVMSWSEAVRGVQPDDDWSRWYRTIVEQGLSGASLLVAPSGWMLDRIESCYGKRARSLVIYNGRTPALFNPFVSKHNYAASVGRLWDEGKQSHLLTQVTGTLPIFLAGATSLTDESASEKVANGDESNSGIRSKGLLSEGEIRELLSRAAVYIATSKYEPFGLAPLEAAFSRCAILANDIPSFREVWGEAACYFRANDADSLRDSLERLHRDPKLRLTYGNLAYERARKRYTADRMVEEYVELYKAHLERQVSAA
jgi:glycogen(starch) synthase